MLNELEKRPRFCEPIPKDSLDLEVVIPVYNRDKELAENIPVLCDYLEAYSPYRWSVTIVDSASTDATAAVAEGLAARYGHRITVLQLDGKGRGIALKAAWMTSGADVVSYMDADLLGGLESFLPLIAPLASGYADLAVGSRLLSGATVTRGWRPRLVSQGYNLLLKALFAAGFSDARCGFKAIRGEVARDLVPFVEDDGRLFDTELLLLAEEEGYRIFEVPVDWSQSQTDNLKSHPNTDKSLAEELRGLLRVRIGRLRRRLKRRYSRFTGRASWRATPLGTEAREYEKAPYESMAVWTDDSVLPYWDDS
ncbi:MAG: glycosyltransferase [Rubrobacteraceae bacterium]